MATESPTKDLVKELRPGFINLAELDGVDFENKTITRDPLFQNPKDHLRSSVLKSLSTAKSPMEIPPIEIWVGPGGKVHVLEGDHRVVNALIKCDGDPNSEWSRIRAFKFLGSQLDAQLTACTANLGAGRSNLNEAEVIGVVERCKNYGLGDEEIAERIGRGSAKLIRKINAILQATPEVIEAAKRGDIEIETGAKIAAKPLREQAEALESVTTELQNNGGDQLKARRDTGVGIQRATLLKLPEIRALLWPHYENWKAMASGEEKTDDYVVGFVNALLCVLKLTPKDCVQDGEEFYSTDMIVSQLDPLYAEYNERLANPPQTRNRRKRD